MFEYEFFDGDHFITFDIIDVDEENEQITVAISNQKLHGRELRCGRNPFLQVFIKFEFRG